MSIEAGTLYVVATPIGNLGDLSARALSVLAGVDSIACEDTRHSGRLLDHFGITTALTPLHEHNETKVLPRLVERLKGGASMALISDAGTPLISDPGYHLVGAARQAGVAVVAVPGPSAVMAALSISGLPTDRFVFEGFLPAKGGARGQRLERLAAEERTMVFFEAPHRITDTLAAMGEVFGSDRAACIAREITKRHETVLVDSLGQLLQTVTADPNQRKGELVVIVAGIPARPGGELTPEAKSLLETLLDELPLKRASALAARLTGFNKNLFYRYGVEKRGDE